MKSQVHFFRHNAFTTTVYWLSNQVGFYQSDCNHIWLEDVISLSKNL